ncbi:MAG: hypothetical protein H7A32_04145 [Deltaproteobacteria bacterium]|nr:hypothetical protein [Deltaproteobacteria bacterium]
MNYSSFSKASALMIGFGFVMIPFLVLYLKWFLNKVNHLVLAFCMLLTLSFTCLSSPSLKACAVCFKDPNDPNVQAIFWGVGFLGVVIVGVLLAIIYIARQWTKRARALGREI